MSSSLMWEIIVHKGKNLSSELKFIFRKRFGDSFDVVLDAGNISYLTGLRDASNTKISKEINDLINAINKNDEIRIWEQF